MLIAIPLYRESMLLVKMNHFHVRNIAKTTVFEAIWGLDWFIFFYSIFEHILNEVDEIGIVGVVGVVGVVKLFYQPMI